MPEAPEEGTITDRLLVYLRDNGADFRVMTHEPTRTSEESARVRGTPLEQGAKAMVFQADGNPVLLVLQAHRRIDSRAFKRAFAVKNLRLISPDELRELTGMEVGAVPPFGNLVGLPTYADRRLLDLPQISFNAGSRTTSVNLATSDYRRLADPTVADFASEE
jgi:Ala-tRNA(Pro) deacylase